jgi:hypothetical protein
MKTNPASFKGILNQKTNKTFYVPTLLILGLSFFACWMAMTGSRTLARKTENLRGTQAVEQLRQTGQYDSLLKAFKAARRDEPGKNTSDLTAAPEAISQTAKLFAPDGEPADFLGYSVALSGDTAIVGAPLDSLETVNPPRASQGSAFIFTRTGTAWTLQQKLLASDGAARDYFGASVSIEGDTAIVGALFDDVGANANQGSAYVFTRSGTIWTEQAKLTATQGAAGDRFGVSAEISGETVVVGTKREQGAAYVFTRSGATWTQQQQLLPSNGAAGDEFGASVAINLDTILVSATGRPVSSADNQGAVYVFTRAGGVWSEQQMLTATDGAAGDRFGSDVAITGDTAIVGAPFDDISTRSDQGSAYVFTRTGGVWTQQTKLTASNGAANDHFGSSVGISGSTIVVTAPDSDIVSGSITYLESGTAYVFTGSGATWTLQRQVSLSAGSLGYRPRFGLSAAISGETFVVGIPGANNEAGYGGVYLRSSNNWNLQAFLANDEPLSDEMSADDGFGLSVALDGDTAVIGAPLNQIGANIAQGSAYVFVRSSATNTWTFQQKLTAADGAQRHFFGGDVAISNDTIVVGNFYFFQGEPDSRSEAAYVFTRSGGIWTQQQKLTASDGVLGDRYGASVGISGETIVVGAPLNGADDRGAAYVYTRSSGVWSERQKLFVENPGTNRTAFGFSVAIDGNTIVAGAPRYGTGGVVYAYVTADLGATWTLQQAIASAETNSCDALGVSVALSADTVISSTNFGLYTGAGCSITNGYKVYVFARSGTSWTQQQRLVSTGDAVTQVAISGDTAVVGVRGVEALFSNILTTAQVFKRSGTTWTLRQILTTADDPTYDGSADVAVSGNTIIVGAPDDELDLTVNQEVDFTSHQGSAYIFTDFGNRTPFDFDGDGRADLSVFRPSEGNWYLNGSQNGFTVVRWGLSNDKLAPADYDGDGKTDVAVWRETEGNFYILNSSDLTVRIENFGLAGDILTVGDWDGDGKADLSTYREGSQSYFFYRGSANNPSGNITYVPWGISGDRPVRGDFDGDGKSDAAVFRPSNNVWYIRNSSNGSVRYDNWGTATDKFVPGDYDGDGKTDLAVFRNGTWHIKQSSNNQARYAYFGLATDLPVPADYDGDGKFDVGVFRPSNSTWFINRSIAGISIQKFGSTGDLPVQNTFVP